MSYVDTNTEEVLFRFAVVVGKPKSLIQFAIVRFLGFDFVD